MIRWTLFWLFLFYSFISSAGKTIAISYFDNTAKDISYNALSKGITDMLITDLSKIEGIKIVEREKLDKLLDEINLEQSVYFDQKTAQQLGKGLGAESILTGAFLVLGNEIRIDARLLNVETYEVLFAEKVHGNTQNFFQLYKELVQYIGQAFKIPQQKTNAILASYKPVSLETITDYGEALDSYDNGLPYEAFKEFHQLNEKYPDFQPARSALDKIKENLIRLELEREKMLEAEISELSATIDPASEDVSKNIVSAWTKLLSSYKYAALLQFNKKLIADGININLLPYGEAYPVTLNEMLLFYNSMAYYQLKKYQELLETGQEFLSMYPTSSYFLSVKGWLDEAIETTEAVNAGKESAGHALIESEFYEYARYLGRYEIGYVSKFFSDKDRERYEGILNNKVLDYLETLGHFPEEFDADDLEDLFETSAKMEKESTLMRIIQLAKVLTKDTEDAESYYDLQEQYNTYLDEKQEAATSLMSIRNIITSYSEEESYKALEYGYRLLKIQAYDDLRHISEKYLAVSDERNIEMVVRSRFDAWENLLDVYDRSGNIDSYAKTLEQFKHDELLISSDRERLQERINRYEKDFRELKRDYETYLEEIVNYPLEKKLMQTYASVFMEYKQHNEEIKYRQKLIKNYSLTPEEKAIEYGLIFIAFREIGNFDKAREVGSFLLREMPASEYAQAVKSYMDIMPE